MSGNVCFYNSTAALGNATFSNSNSKDTTTDTPLAYFVTNVVGAGGNDTGLDATSAAFINLDDNSSCDGATEANIWKGSAGSNDPLETF
jgi:hypothetical protein